MQNDLQYANSEEDLSFPVTIVLNGPQYEWLVLDTQRQNEDTPAGVSVSKEDVAREHVLNGLSEYDDELAEIRQRNDEERVNL
jgi:hypothetical protein